MSSYTEPITFISFAGISLELAKKWHIPFFFICTVTLYLTRSSPTCVFTDAAYFLRQELGHFEWLDTLRKSSLVQQPFVQ